MTLRAFALSLTLGLAAASPAMAQTADEDWQIVRDPAKQTIMAAAAFETGLVIGVRCTKGSFGALIGGLPLIDEERRPLRVGFGEDDLHEEEWMVGEGRTTAFARMPAPFARRLREGGVMNLVVPGGAGQGRNLRHVVTLPPSTAAIDEVLSACGRPLTDPRDAEMAAMTPDALPEDTTWKRPPRPTFPTDAWAIGVGRGYAVVSCLTSPDGRLRDCVVESEHPMGAGFGEASLRAMPAARLGRTSDPDAPIGLGRVAFSVDFVTEESSRRR